MPVGSPNRVDLRTRMLPIPERANVRYGSTAVIETHSSPMSALGRKADVKPGRMSALTDTGRSEVLRRSNLNGSYRPIPDAKSRYAIRGLDER